MRTTTGSSGGAAGKANQQEDRVRGAASRQRLCIGDAFCSSNEAGWERRGTETPAITRVSITNTAVPLDGWACLDEAYHSKMPAYSYHDSDPSS